MPTDRPAASSASIPALGVLTAGFGTAVAMWFVGYLTHFPGLSVPLALTAGLMAAVQLAGGACAARTMPRPVPAAALAGLVSSLVNLLIVGSIVSSPDQPVAVREHWWLMVIGTLAFGPVVAAIGGLIGMRKPKPHATRQQWLARLAIVAAISALPVLLSGGIVTSAEAGKAVPNWPGSYEYPMFLFPLQHMTGGIYYEHAHRLFGTLVGLCTLTMFIAVLVCERRRWVKFAAMGALLLVIAQGVAGGLRVNEARVEPVAIGAAVEQGVALDQNREIDTKAGVAWAVFHGVTGQITFSCLCVVAAFLTPLWINPPARRIDGLLRTLATAALVAYLLQLFLGAGLRHTGKPAFQHPHIAMSVIVLILSMLAGFRARARHADVRPLKFFGTLMAHGVGAQFLIGLSALIFVLPHKNDPTYTPALIIATAHQFMGALLIASTAIVFAWSRRIVEKGKAAPAA